MRHPVTLHKSGKMPLLLAHEFRGGAGGGRVGEEPPRRSPLPSSNRTCGFPASGLPENFQRQACTGNQRHSFMGSCKPKVCGWAENDMPSDGRKIADCSCLAFRPSFHLSSETCSVVGCPKRISLPPAETVFSAGSLRSPGVTRIPRYYEPLRFPTKPGDGYVFPLPVGCTDRPIRRPLRRASQVPRLVSRCPPSSTTPESPNAAHARYLAFGVGFTQFGKLATLMLLSRGRIRFTCVTADIFTFQGFIRTDCSAEYPVGYMANEHLPRSVPFN